MLAEVHADIKTPATSWIGEGSNISSQAATKKLLRGRGGYTTEPARAGMVSLDVELLSVTRCVSEAPTIVVVLSGPQQMATPAGSDAVMADAAFCADCAGAAAATAAAGWSGASADVAGAARGPTAGPQTHRSDEGQ